MTGLDGLLVGNVLDEEDPNRLAAFLAQQDSDFDFGECWSCLSTKDAAKFHKGVLKQVRLALAHIHAEPEDQQEQNEEASKASEAAMYVASLKTLISWIHFILLDSPEDVNADILAAAVALHDEGLLAVPYLKDLQDAVCKLCITWWQKSGVGKESLVAQTLPHTLVKALTSGKAADVKKVYMLRDSLKLFDFEDDSSILDLKRLLLRAAFSPSFLRCADGRKFLPYVFALDQQMVRELGAIIRNQIPAGRKSILVAYGEILYRAWKEASGMCRLEVEDFVQGLMRASILAETLALNTAIRHVLDGFHSKKAQSTVDALLLRLYEPLLFRGLAAANSNVRRNSLLVMFDAFPLQDPALGSEAVDEMLTQQIQAVVNALSEDCGAIRTVAATGCFSLLDRFWELLPSNIISGFLKRMLGQLAYDSASPQVRVAVLNGFIKLISNPIAHTMLKPHLSGLKSLLWDPAIAVRCAFVDLLISVQRVNGFSIADLTNPTDLLESLSKDKGKPGRKLQKLLLPTYFPNLEEGPAIIAHLLRICPEAGHAFCKHLADSSASGSDVSNDELVGLASALKDHLLACPPQQKRTAGTRSSKRKQRPSSGGLDNSDEAETESNWQSILGGLCSISQQLTQDTDTTIGQQQWLDDEDLCLLHESAPNSASRALVLEIAAAVPSCEAVQRIQQRCANLFRTADHQMQVTELHALLKCLARGGKGAHIVQELLESADVAHRGSDSKCLGIYLQASRCVDVMLRDSQLKAALFGDSSDSTPETLRTISTGLRASAEAYSAHLQQEVSKLDGQSQSTVDQAGLSCNAIAVYARFVIHDTCLNRQNAEQVGEDSDASEISGWESAVSDVLSMLAGLVEKITVERDAEILEELVKDSSNQASKPKTKRARKSQKAKDKSSLQQTPLTAHRTALVSVAELTAVVSDAMMLLPETWVSAARRALLKACRSLLEWTEGLPVEVKSEIFDSSNGVDCCAFVGLSMRLLSHQQLAPAEPATLDGSTAAEEEDREEADKMGSLILRHLQAPGFLNPVRMLLPSLLAALNSRIIPEKPSRWLMELCMTLGEEILLEGPKPDHSAVDPQENSEKENQNPSEAPNPSPKKTSAEMQRGSGKDTSQTSQQKFFEAIRKAVCQVKEEGRFLEATAHAACFAANSQQCSQSVLGALYMLKELSLAMAKTRGVDITTKSSVDSQLQGLEEAIDNLRPVSAIQNIKDDVGHLRKILA